MYAQKLLEEFYTTETMEPNILSTHTSDDSAFWSEQETLLLISLYAEHIDDFSHAKKKKYVWDIIAEKMSAHNYKVSDNFLFLFCNSLKNSRKLLQK